MRFFIRVSHFIESYGKSILTNIHKRMINFLVSSLITDMKLKLYHQNCHFKLLIKKKKKKKKKN